MKLELFMGSITFFLIAVGLSISFGRKRGDNLFFFLLAKVAPIMFLGLSGGLFMNLLLSYVLELLW
jgi:hypothetical protein